MASAATLDKLEEILDKFLSRCEDLGVKISSHKFKMGSRVKFRGFIVTQEDG